MRCDVDPPLFNLSDNATQSFLNGLKDFNESYTTIHMYLCILVCSVGVVLNSLHVYVLSRKLMRAYVINGLLAAMAVCDALTMASYLVYIIKFRLFETDGVFGYSYGWLAFLIVHVTSSIGLHTGSLYISVTMAYIRWTALDRLDAKWINDSAIRHIFVFTAVCVTLISIPTLMVHKIVSVNEVLGTNDSELENLYTVQLVETDINGCTLYRANLWISGIFFKAVPCILLLWFTIALIWKLCEMSNKRRRLRGDRNNNPAKYTTKHARKYAKSIQIDKTTLMLIIMLVVFLCTELPQGALAILSAIYPTHVGTMVYVNVGELLDLLSLVNCLTSFILYSTMSSTYRNTFKSIFCNCGSSKTIAQKNAKNLHSLRLLLP